MMSQMIPATQSRHAQMGKCIQLPNQPKISNNELLVDFPRTSRERLLHQAKPPKEVKFSATSSLHMYVKDDSESGASSWHSKEDYAKFRSDTRAEVAVIRRSAWESMDPQVVYNDGSQDLILRGVEHLVCKKTLRTIMDARTAHRQAVFEEQWHQVNNGAEDVEVLRAVSKQHSRWGERRALKMAGHRKVAKRGSTTPAA